MYDRVHMLILLLRIFAGVEQRPDQVLTSQVKAQQYLTRSNINDPDISDLLTIAQRVFMYVCVRFLNGF